METLQRTANRGSISTGYDIDNSLKLEADNSERLYFTPSSSGNRKTWTFSCWFKITEADKYCMLMGSADTYMYIDQYGGDMHIRLNGSNYLYTTPVYRDTSAWYHFVLAVDTTQSTAANRAKLYVNGEQVTEFATEVYPSQNLDTSWNFTNAHYVGGWTSTLYDSSGYIAEVHSVDGQQLAPTEFGEFDEDTGIWKPIEYTGTYGTNGFYLEFKNSADLGDDTSGNNKNFVLQNITSVDQATDTPTNNFCTLNVLQNTANYNTNVTTEGATKVYSTSNYSPVEASIGVMGGKWYWEGKYNIVNVGHMPGIGVPGEWVYTAFFYVGRNDYGIGTLNGNWYYNGAVASSTDASSWSTGDIVSIALDMDNYKIYMAVNGSWAGTSNPATNTGGYDFSGATNLTSNFVVPVGRIETANASYPMELNFGGYTTMSIASGNSDANGYGNFEYAPPSGYYAICTKNLAEFG